MLDVVISLIYSEIYMLVDTKEKITLTLEYLLIYIEKQTFVMIYDYYVGADPDYPSRLDTISMKNTLIEDTLKVSIF
jgi:hypothetical protein